MIKITTNKGSFLPIVIGMGRLGWVL